MKQERRQEPLMPEERARRNSMKLWVALWLCAIFLLFTNLGVLPVSGSEGRWLQIVREMFRTGDFLHPTINGEPYNDKPLLTYWFTAAAALFKDRRVTEITARIPSALAALGTLWVVIAAAKQLFNTRTAMIAGWLFATCFSFGFWGRLGEADMANVFFSAAAVLCFLKYREKQSFAGYTLFFVICAVGAHAKGMGAIAVPILCVLADLIIFKRWKFHLGNPKWIAGAVIGGIVYAIPFVLAAKIPAAIQPEMQEILDFDGTVKTSGFALALRENVVRFFAPFDHKENFFSYFVHLPRHLMPWTPLFLLALYTACSRWKKLSANCKWLLLSIGLIFLFFTLSGSKRHYYIMPLIPFCVMLTAYDLSGGLENNRIVRKIRDVLLVLYRFIPPAAALFLTLGALTLSYRPDLLPAGWYILLPLIRQTIMASFMTFAVLLILNFQMKFYRQDEELLPCKQVSASLFSVMVLMIFTFVYFFPATSLFRTEKTTLTMIGNYLKKEGITQNNLYFLDRDPINAVYYLNMPFKVKLLKNAEDVRRLSSNLPEGKVFVFGQARWFAALPPDLLEKIPVAIQERIQPWEKEKPRPGKVQNGKKYVLRVFRLK